MKWYIWLAIAVALFLIIYLVTKKKSTVASSTTVTDKATQLASNFNPYQLTLIS